MKKLSYLSFLFLLVAPEVFAGVFTLPFEAGPKPLSEIFSSVLDEKKKLLADLRTEKEALDSAYQQEMRVIETNAQEVKNKIEHVQRDLQERLDDEFLNYKSVRLNELYQVLKEAKRTKEKLVLLYEEYIKYVQQYVDDSSFETFKREYRIQDKIQYNFEDLQKMHEYIRAQEKMLLRAVQQERSVRIELETAERNLIAAKIAYRKKKEEFQQEVTQSSGGAAATAYGQKIAMMELEEHYYGALKDLNELITKEIKLRISFANFQSFIAYCQLDILKEFRKKIKPAVTISPAGLASAKEERDKKRSAYFKIKNNYGQELEKVVALEREKEKELHEKSEQLGVSLGRDLDEWSRVPAETVKEYVNVCTVGVLNTQLRGLQRQQEVFESLINFEDEQYAYEDIKVRAREMYFKIILTRQGSEQELNREKRAYETQKANAESAIARYKEKINAVADHLSTQKKILDNISTLRQGIEKQRNRLFKESESELNECLSFLLQAERNVRQQVDILSKLTGVYSSTVSSLESTTQVINFILSEFEAVTIWYRPEGAITLRGIKNLFSDVRVFFADMRLYLRKVSLFDVFLRFKRLFTMPRALTSLLFTLVLIIASFFFIGWGLGALSVAIQAMFDRSKSGMRILILLIRTIVDFALKHYVLIGTWFGLYMLFMMQPIITTYGWVFFYILSIFYWLYVVTIFLSWLMKVNEQEHEAFFAAEFQNRFYWVISFLLYSTIILGLFRQAFVLANYPRSEVPAILLALNFIIFQLSLIFLIAKEQVLNVIPETNTLWQWVKLRVDSYYYGIIFALILVIIMSNPYVGYLRLASYMLFGVIYSALLFMALYWLHGFCKRIASRIFFQEREDIIRERFSNGKTWFGFAIIVSFSVLSFIGLIILLKIWGWQIHVSDVGKWFDRELGTTTLTPSELLKFMTFIVLGFVVAYGLNRYVLDKVFDLLLIDAGVQHTVSSISQYVVVIVAIFLGFQSIGLGQPVGYFMLTLAFSIGFVLKEPISDFIAYFIILVQRPIKIGDYIKVDEQVMGVVRQITARSVILRRKNSTTIIVPNLQIISKPIVNWNYSRSFIAFEDIPVSIDYSADPALVKRLLHEVLDEHPNVLKNPRPIIRLNNFNDSGYLFIVRGFLSSVYTLEQWDISSDIRLAIVKKLRDHSIKIGIPTSIYISRNGNDELSTGFLLGADQHKDRKD